MRLVFVAWRLQIKLFSRSPFFISLALLTPIVYVTISLLMASTKNSFDTIHLVFGAGLLGTWSVTLYGAGESLYMQRFTGTLQLLLGSPKSFFGPVLGFSLASATLGLYSIAAVWFWGVLIFNVQMGNANVLGLIVNLIISLFALTSIGVVLASLYVLTRQAMTISNVMEYPIWILSGMLFPVSYLWGWLAWLGKLLPLGWAVDGVNRAIANRPYLFESCIAVLLSFFFVAIGYVLLKKVDHRVRITGELTLR